MSKKPESKTQHSLQPSNPAEAEGPEGNVSFLHGLSATRHSESNPAALLRENQSLHLELLHLERRIQGILDVIQSDPQLESLYLRQEQLRDQKKMDLYRFQLEKMG